MALKSFRVTVSLPGELQPLIHKRIKEEKYPSESAYLAGLVIFDCYARRHHWLTGTLAREPQWLRDQVLKELVETFDQEKTPGWFEKRILELRKEDGLP